MRLRVLFSLRLFILSFSENEAQPARISTISDIISWSVIEGTTPIYPMYHVSTDDSPNITEYIPKLRTG